MSRQTIRTITNANEGQWALTRCSDSSGKEFYTLEGGMVGTNGCVCLTADSLAKVGAAMSAEAQREKV